MMDEPVSLPFKMHSMIGVTSELEPEKRGPALRNRLEGEASQYKRLLNRELLRDPNDGANYFKRFLQPHVTKGAQTVFLYYIVSCSSSSTTEVPWICKSGWLDFNWLETDLLSPEAIAFVAQRRREHEERQAELAGVAAALPGQEPHVHVPWTDEHALAAFRQLNENRRAQQRMAFPLGDTLPALTVCKSGRSDARSEEHTHKYHGTPWANTRSAQCARTQRSFPGNVLHDEDSSGQSYDATLWHWTEKIFPRPGRRRTRRNWRLSGRRWWRWRRRIPGCFRRCFLGLRWRWLHMVSEKVPRKTDQTRQR